MSLTQILLELADITNMESYDYDYNKTKFGNHNYEFTTDDNIDFEVLIQLVDIREIYNKSYNRNGKDFYRLDFGRVGEIGIGDYGDTKNTIKILNTIFQIALDFYEKNRNNILGFAIEYADEKRKNIFSKYVKRAFPNADIEGKKGRIIIKL